MVAANYTIRCQVVAIPVPVRRCSLRGSSRPSELMRRTDPMIAKLVQKLQEEIRAERRLESRNQPLEHHRKLSLLAQNFVDFEVATPPLRIEEEMGRQEFSFDCNYADCTRNRWDKD
jgi:hypothetical protein